MEERTQQAIRTIRQADNAWALAADLNQALAVGIQNPPPDAEASNAIVDAILRRVSQMEWRPVTFFCHHFATDHCPNMKAGARLTDCPLRRSCRRFGLDRVDIY